MTAASTLTLGNMRSLGVRSLTVTCEVCHHEAVLPADHWSDAVLVRALCPRMVCTPRDCRRGRETELAGDEGERKVVKLTSTRQSDGIPVRAPLMKRVRETSNQGTAKTRSRSGLRLPLPAG
jgi:hypothetical protein